MLSVSVVPFSVKNVKSKDAMDQPTVMKLLTEQQTKAGLSITATLQPAGRIQLRSLKNNKKKGVRESMSRLFSGTPVQFVGQVRVQLFWIITAC